MKLNVGKRERLMYRFFGPTTIHIQHELCLSIAMFLLTLATLQSSYQNVFGTVGDFKYAFFAALWLSRYLIFRCLYSSDSSTNRRPTFSGLVVHWISSHVTAGQSFDRPSSQVLAKQGTNHHQDNQLQVSIADFLSPTVLYGVQWVKIWLGYPLMGLQARLRNSREPADTSLRKDPPVGERKQDSTNVASSIRSLLNRVHSTWNRFCVENGITLHFVMEATVLVFYFWYIVFWCDPLKLSSKASWRDFLTFERQSSHGVYRELSIPHWKEVLCAISAFGTLASLLFYRRILLPFPDLVAGTNVLKGIRNEAKVFAKSSRGKAQRDNVEQPWPEQQKSIIGENRLRLICKVGLIRIVENLLVCFILPRSEFVCLYTEHCSKSLSLTELTKVLVPVGVASPLRSDMFDQSGAFVTTERLSALLAWVSVITISISCLLGQATMLNRSYLGIMGYVAGGWTVLDSNDPAVGGHHPQWDPRRRYKKGDIIAQSYPGLSKPFVYRATTNSPEGRPFDVFLRASHDLFRNELGHPATSDVLGFLWDMQVFMVFLTLFVILFCQLLDYGYGSLLWTLAANIIAAYGTLGIALPRQTEIQDLAKSIAQ